MTDLHWLFAMLCVLSLAVLLFIGLFLVELNQPPSENDEDYLG